MFGRMERKLLALTAAAVVASAALVGDARDARADGDVKATGKGIVGGALLGGEVVDITMAIVGVQSGWPYLVFGGIGAIGGGIGGHFVEKTSTAEPSVYML